MRFLGFLSKNKSADSEGRYERLPTTNASFQPLRRSVNAFAARRLCWLSVISITAILWLGIYSNLYDILVAWATVKLDPHSSNQTEILPPTYDRYYEIERNYPQHNASLPFPEGRDDRFMWVSNQHFGLGWNNVFQTLYMMAHLAYLSKRAFVFRPYTWNPGPEPYDTYNGHLIPSRIPLAALVDNPIAGGSFPPDQSSPRAVSIEFFNEICPEDRRNKISIKEMNEGLEGRPVIDIVEKYASKLLELDDSCVELYGGLEHPFDYMQFGDASMETVYPTLSQSPILREFNWAPLILAALRTNALDVSPDFDSDPPPNLVPDLMAIHIRRGDYEQHCHGLADWSARYMGWSQTPGLPDRFVPPPVEGEERKAEYMRHCYPDIPQIVRRVEKVRYEWETRPDRSENESRLKRLYILTNAQRGWIEALKLRLKEAGDWEVINSSRDMTLSPEQKYVAQAVDMAIAERAAVFIGNGFSSLTANTVLLRRIHNLTLVSNHFW